MALDAGDKEAQTGMTKAIYDQLNTLLSPAIPAASLPDVQRGWRTLAYAISKGVVDYLVANMEVTGIQTSGTLTVNVAAPANPGAVIGSGTSNFTAAQTGPTTGHVK